MLSNKVYVLCVFYNVFHLNTLTTEELLMNKVYVLRLYIPSFLYHTILIVNQGTVVEHHEQGLYLISSYTHLFGQDYIRNWATID